MTKTAVEWLMSQIGQNLEMPIDEGNRIIKQAKELEKQQIGGFAEWCVVNGWNYNSYIKMWWKLYEDNQTTDQLIELYLTEKQ